MKLKSYVFNGVAVAVVVLASGVLVAEELAIDTDTAVAIAADNAAVVAASQPFSGAVAVAPQPAIDATGSAGGGVVSDVVGTVVATVHPQVIDPADQSNLATYGMAVARCMIYEALQKHTPMDDNTAQRQALWKGILFYGGLAVSSMLVPVGLLLCSYVPSADEKVAPARGIAQNLGSRMIMMGMCITSLLTYFLSLQSVAAYFSDRQTFLTEAELQALIKTFGSLKANELAESLTAVKQWFCTIQTNLCDLGFQKTISLFDVQLHQVMVKVNEVLAEKALIDQKRHPTEQEVVAIQTKLAGALGAFAAYVLAVLNDKENYLKQAS